MESPYQTNYQEFTYWRADSNPARGRGRFASLRSFGGEIVLALLLLAGAFVLVNPFHWLPFMPQAGATGWWVLLGGVALGALYLRWRIIRHPVLTDWACPECRSLNMARIPRRFRHRLLGLVQIPAHRYFCSQCEWKGLRIDP